MMTEHCRISRKVTGVLMPMDSSPIVIRVGLTRLNSFSTLLEAGKDLSILQYERHRVATFSEE
jgi:hypothetical protein